MDARHWKCNLCYRANDLPEDFAWDPQTKTFGDPSRRPELQETTIEYIAPAEYMLRPPQPPIYLFIFDVSSAAVDCGYLHTFSEQLLLDIDKLPGQDQALIGFLGFDSALHFFQFDDAEGEPRHIIEFDVEESFAPVFSGLFVELSIFKEHEIGGRITVLTASMPNIGIGALKCPEPSAAKVRVDNFSKFQLISNLQNVALAPQIDFYKSLALECTGKQIAIDLFVVGGQIVDLLTLADMSRFSSGTIFHFPGYHFLRDQVEVKRFQMVLRRYFTRKLGLEAVLRIRLSLHTFYGNFFVRSTDLLALPNVSPDSAMGVQIKHDEVISNSHVCFQAALLYTSTKVSGNLQNVALAPQIDFYKSLALECTGKQIAIDLFVVGGQIVDLLTLADMSRFSSGTIFHFPGYHFLRDQVEVKRFQMVLRRYFTRKLGLEAVLRIRCSRGLSLHTFYGNFFVRSTDLLALPNVSPDSAMGVQIKHDEVISNSHVCFQAALLYTSTKGDRRIRVHTLCLPVLTHSAHVFSSLDVNASMSLLSKMEQCMARICLTKAFSEALQRVSSDERVATFLLYKNAPMEVILLELCPALYALHLFVEQHQQSGDLQNGQMPFPDRLPPSYEHISQSGIYLLDIGTLVFIYVGSASNVQTLYALFGVGSFAKLDTDSTVTELDTPPSKYLHAFLRHLQEQRGNVYAPVKVIRDDNPRREMFASRLVQDRSDSSHSYNEFMQFLQREVNKANK
uniref:Sec23/sec24 transport family protein n=1 Tax=Globodera pallida TaxID=36090 RepID=A0A183C0I0_GLOPA